MEWDILNTELVVMSACQSGKGQINSDGEISVPRALQNAILWMKQNIEHKLLDWAPFFCHGMITLFIIYIDHFPVNNTFFSYFFHCVNVATSNKSSRKLSLLTYKLITK
jgi:hypothetical protein